MVVVMARQKIIIMIFWLKIIIFEKFIFWGFSAPGGVLDPPGWLFWPPGSIYKLKKKIRNFDFSKVFFSILLINLSQTGQIKVLRVANNRIFHGVSVGIDIIDRSSIDHRYIDRSSIDHRLIIDWSSIDHRSIIDRLSIDYWWIIDRSSIDHW